MEFALVFRTEDEVWFSLTADEETYEKYPFTFTLEIGYKLAGNELKVIWNVSNEDNKKMYFSIGGHPAFNCPLKEGEKQEDYQFQDVQIHTCINGSICITHCCINTIYRG